MLMTRHAVRSSVTAGALALALSTSMALAAPAGAWTGPHDRLDVTTVAHRGASWDAPENTIAATVEGIAQDAELVEIDVQRSKDGELVLMHDVSLARTTDVEQKFPDRAPWHVGDFTFAELRTLDAGSWKSTQFSREQIPTLDETLDALSGSGVGLLLEVKSPGLYPGLAEDLVAELRERPRWWRSAPLNQQLVVQSFDWNFMAEFHTLAPHLKAGLLGRAELADLRNLSWADQINPGFTSIDAAWVEAVQASGFEVFVYTVNAPIDMARMIDAGVDGIITDRPALLKSVLSERTAAAA